MTVWPIVLAVLVGLAVGAGMYALWLQRTSRQRVAPPTTWPLNLRLLANSEERQVWSWLTQVFYNHQIMVKIPVTRFTLPVDASQSQHLYQLLSGVYCTLTICGIDGRVIGCVDVLGRNGLSTHNRRLKRALLAQCGLAYLVVEPANLMPLLQIRAIFLGEKAALSYAREDTRKEAIVVNARNKLSAALERQRRSRSFDSMQTGGNQQDYPSSFGAGESGFATSSNFGQPSDFGPEWQKNSFLMPLDSRRAELAKH